MQEPMLISPLLDDFIMGDPISNHHGVRCCPALKKETEEKYIVKIISVPSSQAQVEALLLTGAYPDEASALSYYKELAEDVQDEAKILGQLSQLEGFLPCEGLQIVPMDGQTGYEIYLLTPYKRTLSRHFTKTPMTHLGAINLGLDLCAALAVCRRSGYLYVDLKPNNVFVTGEQEFRIGDLGFIKLDSLKYASLPDKYRSAYTAPEISDALSSLNSTIDVYAVGLILYQAYNNGELPFVGDTAPADVFQPPMFADYELSEIILKACAPDPVDRWQDPIQLGQALVSYMQRNGANDTPIVPVPVADQSDAEEEETKDQEDTQDDSDELTDVENFEGTDDEISQAPSVEDPTDIFEECPSAACSEDGVEESSLLTEPSDDEVADDQSETANSYSDITDEVSDILSQADELAAHEVPDPVVVPEQPDLPIPEAIPAEEPEESEEQEEVFQSDEPAEPTEEPEANEVQVDTPATVKKASRRWLPITLICLFLISLLAGGAYYYNNHYLQPVESIRLEGKEDGLTVYIDSQISDEKLSVVCADTFGNQITVPVLNGKAEFSKLAANTRYDIYLQINGFHKLTGKTSAVYSTPVQTTIVQFGAVTGSEDGSVILGFIAEGPTANQWKVHYRAEGEETKSAVFTSGRVTLTGLTVGKEYTFTLVPDTELYLTGTSEITFVASKLIYAQNLTVTGCINNKLSVQWSAPEGSTVDSWTVRCYNSNGYDKTLITSGPSAEFEIPDHTSAYTVEVAAGGMSVWQSVSIPQNSVTVTDFRAETTDFQTLKLSWNINTEIPKGGLVLKYQIAGTTKEWTVVCNENSVSLTPVLPGTVYSFTLQSSDGTTFLSEKLVCEVPAAPDFKGTFGGLEVGRDDLVFSMCKTPSVKNWTYRDVKDSDFTTSFTAKQKASFLVKLNASYGSDSTKIDVLYLVRDSSGNPVSSSLQTFKWGQMWNKYYCELDVPSIPKTPGDYIINIYFNGGLAAEQSFTVVG